MTHTTIPLDCIQDQGLAYSNQHGIYVVVGWTVAIPKEVAVHYVKTFDASPAEGFYRVDGNVVLSHSCGKLYLTEQEANAIVGLIKTAFMH